MRRLLFLTTIGWHLLSSTPAQSSDAAAPQEPSNVQQFTSVLVLGLGDPATTSYANLLRGVQAFHDNHAMAPTADLKFRITELVSTGGPLKLRIETEDKVIPIEIDDEGLFVLPDPVSVGAMDGDLVANRSSGNVHIGPEIRSAGFDNERFRLGDERLWCEVVSAIKRDEIPLPVRMMVALKGPICKNSRIKIFRVALKRTVLGGKLSEGSTQVDLQVDSNNSKVYFPLHDTTWSNEAIVQLQMVGTNVKREKAAR